MYRSGWLYSLALIAGLFLTNLGFCADPSSEGTPDLWGKAKEITQSTLKSARGLLNGEERSKTGELWEKIIPRLESVLKLEDRQEALPKSAWFTTDKASNQEKINELLDEAVEILNISTTQEYRRQIQELEWDIREARQKMVEYEEKRVFAPKRKPVWKPWETTEEAYSGKIEELKDRIAGDQEEIHQIKRSLQKELQNIGLNLTQEQLDFLLSTVIGDNVLQVSVAFNNVKAITQQLEQIMVKSGENVGMARRYYGMYTVLLEILDHMYQQLIREINQKYIPQIEGGKDQEGKEIKGIIPKTETLLKETEELLKTIPPGSGREILESNIKAQKLTLEVAKSYKGYLETQRDNLFSAKQRLTKDLSTAKNTYETVKVSSELVDMMKSGQSLFDTLRNLQMPELRAFENLEMKREFEKLTIQLRAGGEG